MSNNSSPLNNIHIPTLYGINKIQDTEFILERDEYNRLSIIKLSNTPYIDFSKYDNRLRRWHLIDKYGKFWKKFLHSVNPATQIGGIFGGFYWTSPSYNYIHIPYDVNTSSEEFIGHIKNDGNRPLAIDGEIVTALEIKQYSPINLMLNDVVFSDLTDYANIKSSVGLNNYSADVDFQFYYDGITTIYTNQDLTLANVDNIKLEYYTTINDIKVVGMMNTSNNAVSNYTPAVDYFMVKLSGQEL